MVRIPLRAALSPAVPGHLSVLDHRDSIHQHILHALGQLVRIVESRNIMHRLRIEHHHIGPHSLLQHAAIGKPHALSRQRRKLADRVFQRQLCFFAHIFAQNARKRPVRAGMRVLLAQQAIRRRA